MEHGLTEVVDSDRLRTIVGYFHMSPDHGWAFECFMENRNCSSAEFHENASADSGSVALLEAEFDTRAPMPVTLEEMRNVRRFVCSSK